MQLTFDSDASRYFVHRLDPYSPEPALVLDTEPGAIPVRLPDGIRIRDVTVEGQGTLSRGTVHCLFYPEGYVDATVIHLIDDGGTIMTLVFQPLTGRVQIMRGDYAPGANGLLAEVPNRRSGKH